MFQVGDRVMYAKRCQTTAYGMAVQEVDTDLFGTRVRVDGKWWNPTALITLAEWKAGKA